MLKNILSTTTLFFLFGTAASADEGAWYMSGQIGVRAVEQQTAQAPGTAIEGELDNGLYLGGALGYEFPSEGVGFRLEAEVASRGGNLNNLSINGAEVPATGEGFSAISFMGNGYVDFNNSSSFTPYLGGGLGIARVNGDIVSGTNSVNDTATSFAIQGIGGVDVSVTRNISVFADIRYFKALDTSLTLIGSAGSGGLDVDYDAFTVGIGARFRF